MKPLFAVDDVPVTASFNAWANQYVNINDGLRMLSAQAANEALRHCRIGKVTRKPTPNTRPLWEKLLRLNARQTSTALDIRRDLKRM